ncbi:MAG: HAMP domain-containing protein [Chitinophagaceae bacterium]|nr:HAMP domain-containing protein [Anaerolineae bacterium]
MKKAMDIWAIPLRNLWPMISGLVIATLAASLFSALQGIPRDDLLILIGLMLITGGISLVIGYALYQQRVIRLMRSLHMSLMVNTMLTIIIVFVNVQVIALSMFITERDSALITALLIFATILALIFGSLHSRLLTHELREIALAADKLGEDNDLVTRLPLFGNDELTSLAASFNKMAERLREADEQKQAAEQLRRDLVAWVSHDLRTPLTSLRAMNEALIDGVVSDAEQSTRYLRDMNREIMALNYLIDDMFELSLLDTRQTKLNFQKTSLRDLLSALLSSMAARATHQNIQFHLEIKDKEIDPVLIAPEKIQRVLHNLVDNAFQHTVAGGKIRITARREEAHVLVEVFNSGSLIPQADLPYIFNQFYRGDKARRDLEGSHRHAGLGLAIAQRFIEIHGGKIWAESRENYGTTFCFSLPNL